MLLNAVNEDDPSGLQICALQGAPLNWNQWGGVEGGPTVSAASAQSLLATSDCHSNGTERWGGRSSSDGE